uniref:protein PAT1 homolog 1-like isoform X2 n=1 Tax=Myxine glutinosa TaxID=7769 RepID=UPI0035902F46
MQRTFSPLMGQGMVDIEGTVKEPSDEEDEDIDQFNDDTFGPGALDEDWEAAHEKLAGLRLGAGGHCMFTMGTNDEGDELGEAELEESLSKLVLEEDLDDIAVIASKKHPVIEIPLSVHSIWGTPPDIGPFSHLPPQFEDEAIVRAGKAMTADEVQQSLRNRAPPPRSTSPVFGSPPVHTAPIGTPPKYPPHPQQILRPIPTHLRPHLHQPRFHGAFNGRLSPSHSQSPGICGPPGPRIHGFPSMQRSPLLHHQSQAGRLSPSQFSCLPTVLPSPLNPLSPLPHKLLPGCPPHLIHQYVRSPHFLSAPAMHALRFPRPVHPGDLHPQHRRLLSLQQQRGKSQQNGVATGCHQPGPGCPSSFDPYANLMTQREKEWVVRIQMLQLQSGGSGVNDYYYKMYFERLERRALASDKTSGGIARKREPLRLITPQVALAEHTYTPVQFHGSLGKLTVSSVNNPRKMIDTGHLARSDDEELKDKQGRDKRRRVLQAIEQAYLLLLQLEDLECLLTRSTPAEREEVALRHDSCRRQLFNMPRKSCIPVDEDEKRAWEEGFVAMMMVRKGRRLIGRMLPFLSASQQAAIVMATANHLTHVVRKDSADEVLLPFLPAFSLALGAQSLPTLTTVLEILTRGRTASSLCLTNRFTAGFVYALVTCGERKLDGSVSYIPIEARQRWLDVLGTIGGELNRTLGGGAEPLATTPLPPAVLAAFRRVRAPHANPTLVPGPLS